MASPSLDSLLEAALAGSRPFSAQDMLMLAVHASLLSCGYECIATGDEVCTQASSYRIIYLLCQHF